MSNARATRLASREAAGTVYALRLQIAPCSLRCSASSASGKDFAAMRPITSGEMQVASYVEVTQWSSA